MPAVSQQVVDRTRELASHVTLATQQQAALGKLQAETAAYVQQLQSLIVRHHQPEAVRTTQTQSPTNHTLPDGAAFPMATQPENQMPHV